jgi:hypothetical protein
MTGIPRDPLAEARAALAGTGFDPIVLEPSPPADLDPDYFADDPTDPAGHTGTVVSPIAGVGDLSWSQLAASNPEIAGFAADHWLGAFKRLQPLGDRYAETRAALHQVAFFAIGPKRHQANGKIGLRYTHRGFGTPFFGDDEQVRVEGDQLIHQTADGVRSTTISTVGEAAAFLDVPYLVEWFPDFHDPLVPVDPGTALAVDPNASLALGDWFGFATSVLEELRRIDGATDVSRVQLWPEHFDPAIEMGSADSGRRAGYGASPGDGSSSEPYLYVAPWSGVPDQGDPYWNAESFGGAALSYEELLAAEDQRGAALGFFRTGWKKLTA